MRGFGVYGLKSSFHRLEFVFRVFAVSKIQRSLP